MTLTEAHQILIERHRKACEEIHLYVVSNGELPLGELSQLRADEVAAAGELARFNRIRSNPEETK